MSLYIYLIDQEILVGGLSVTYVWDWVSLGELFYQNIEILNCLVHHAWSRFKKDAVNMSAFTTCKNRYVDLIKAGFKLEKTVEINEQDTYYYMTLDQTKESEHETFQLIISEVPIDKYQAILKEEVAIFNKKNHIVDVTDTFNMIAKDGDICVGGVQSEVYNDMVYVSRIAILPSYRHQKIGSALMNHVIQYAKDSNMKYITLGTADFQARPFYEKFGFKVVYKKFDNPKGYYSYTMVKML